MFMENELIMTQYLDTKTVRKESVENCFIFIADLHLGTSFPFKYDPTVGFSRRTLDFFNVFDQINEYIINNDKIAKKTTLFILGDLYDAINPTPTIRAKTYEKLKAICDLGVQVHVIAGNHDITVEFEKSSSLNEIGLIKNLDIEVYREIKSIIIGDTGFLFIPFIYPQSIVERLEAKYSKKVPASDYNQFAQVELRKKIVKESSNLLDCRRRIALPHYFLSGARMSESYSLMPNELTIPLDFFNKNEQDNFPGFDLVIAGHVHYPQKITDKVFYVGSTERKFFNERDEIKRFLVLTDKLESINIECRKQVEINLRIEKNLTPSAVNAALMTEASKFDVKEAMVKFIISCKSVDRQTIQSSLDFSTINKMAFHVYDPEFISLEQAPTLVNQEISNYSPSKFFLKYAKENNLDIETANLGLDIIKRIQKESEED